MKYLIPEIEKWFYSKYSELQDFQIRSIVATHSRESSIVISPTGTGKTFAAFLGILNELIGLSKSDMLENKTYAIYVSPLRALTYDIKRNLQEPLNAIESLCNRKFGIKIGLWTSDVKEKNAHIILTTPESLGNIITQGYANNIEWLIADEIHSLIESKRGVLLDLLTKLIKPKSRMYLTATPVGDMRTILDVQNVIENKYVKNPDLALIHEDAFYDSVMKLKKKVGTILIFTNTRPLAEKIAITLKSKSDYVVEVHHSSLGYTFRKNIEKNLKEGKIDIVVSSTSLELGIDIGNVDAVILYGSPKTINRALQRIGRSGHGLNKKPLGIFIANSSTGLLEELGIIKGISEKNEEIKEIKKPYDVLAHFILLISLINTNHKYDIHNVFELVKKSTFYSELSFLEFKEIVDYYVEHKLINTDFTARFPRWKLLKNFGPIPSSDFILVKEGNRILGMLDSSFAENMIKNDKFSLGGRYYEFLKEKNDRIFVKKSAGGNISRWYSQYLPISYQVGTNIKKVVEKSFEYFKSRNLFDLVYKPDLNSFIEMLNLTIKYPVAISRREYQKIFDDLKKIYFFFLPYKISFKSIICEYFKYEDESYFVVHTFLGKRLNDTLSRVLAGVGNLHKDTRIGIDDISLYISSNKLNPDYIINNIKGLSKEDFINIVKNNIKNTIGFGKKARKLVAKLLLIDTKGINFGLLNYLRSGLPEKEAFRTILYDDMDVDKTYEILKENFQMLKLSLPSPLAYSVIERSFTDVIVKQPLPEFLKEIKQMIDVKINLELGKRLKK